jgi:hypothetical protein
MTLPPTEGTELPATTRPSTARRARGQKLERPKRPWAVTANALLLLLETAGFGALSAVYLSPLGLHWPFTPEMWEAQRAEVVLGFLFVLLAMLALAAAMGFLRVARGAWLLAVLVQGITLALALLLYFEDRSAYVYLIMLISVVMVLYLHQDDVQAAFRPVTLTPNEAEPAG